jgi:hypothetical protein
MKQGDVSVYGYAWVICVYQHSPMPVRGGKRGKGISVKANATNHRAAGDDGRIAGKERGREGIRTVVVVECCEQHVRGGS